ncbi:hypothetical protein Pan44_53840 [Caulifigura coniformis]|uniref:Uncharacterized protein n=1 Tax=Caulifigura coniformis TaxID=2527983 RepID=A0A517SMJ2_9PLAN|nr:DUF2806 domain-containing protein [Caulifigura coniformis]QDT57316.1 hypothetical protein Pan44_53840 [Caulifigura coniformis]
MGEQDSGLTTLANLTTVSNAAWAVAKGAIPRSLEWMLGTEKKADARLRESVAAAYVDNLRQIHDEQHETREQLRANSRNLSAQRHLQWLQEQEQLAIKKVAAIHYAATLPDYKESDREIEQHWVDTFEVHARRRTEPWRSQLLSRALAHEAINPGTISLKALWLIGTMEREVFDYLSAFLNTGYVSRNLTYGGSTFVVRSYGGTEETKYLDLPVPIGEGGDTRQLWQVYTRHSQEALATELSTQGQYDVGCCVATYGVRSFYEAMHHSPGDVTSDGYTLTSVAAELSLLHEHQSNDLGERIFSDEMKYGTEGLPADALRALLRDRVEAAEQHFEKRPTRPTYAFPQIEVIVAAFAREFGESRYLEEIGADLGNRVGAIIEKHEAREKERSAARAAKTPRPSP